MDDVINASGVIQYNEDGVGLVKTCVDGWLLTGQHGGVIDEFLSVTFIYLANNI